MRDDYEVSTPDVDALVALAHAWRAIQELPAQVQRALEAD